MFQFSMLEVGQRAVHREPNSVISHILLASRLREVEALVIAAFACAFLKALVLSLKCRRNFLSSTTIPLYLSAPWLPSAGRVRCMLTIAAILEVGTFFRICHFLLIWYLY
jgi:hypothetical protein